MHLAQVEAMPARRHTRGGAVPVQQVERQRLVAERVVILHKRSDQIVGAQHVAGGRHFRPIRLGQSSNSSPGHGAASSPRLSSNARAPGKSARQARSRKKSAVRRAAIFSATATLMNWLSVVPSALASRSARPSARPATAGRSSLASSLPQCAPRRSGARHRYAEAFGSGEVPLVEGQQVIGPTIGRYCPNSAQLRTAGAAPLAGRSRASPATQP